MRTSLNYDGNRHGMRYVCVRSEHPKRFLALSKTAGESHLKVPVRQCTTAVLFVSQSVHDMEGRANVGSDDVVGYDIFDGRESKWDGL